MSRHFAPISKEELCDKIKKTFADAIDAINPYKLKELLAKDLKVEFDTENFEYEKDHFNVQLEGITGPVTLENGLTFVGFTAGGDWEHPVYFIVYWDGKKLRGYIPKEGNPWNTSTKQAYGNDEEADTKNMQKRYPDSNCTDPSDCDFDGAAIKQDILNRLTPTEAHRLTD